MWFKHYFTLASGICLIINLDKAKLTQNSEHEHFLLCALDRKIWFFSRMIFLSSASLLLLLVQFSMILKIIFTWYSNLIICFHMIVLLKIRTSGIRWGQAKSQVTSRKSEANIFSFFCISFFPLRDYVTPEKFFFCVLSIFGFLYMLTWLEYWKYIKFERWNKSSSA